MFAHTICLQLSDDNWLQRGRREEKSEGGVQRKGIITSGNGHSLGSCPEGRQMKRRTCENNNCAYFYHSSQNYRIEMGQVSKLQLSVLDWYIYKASLIPPLQLIPKLFLSLLFQANLPKSFRWLIVLYICLYQKLMF